jgi:thioredoxin 1
MGWPGWGIVRQGKRAGWAIWEREPIMSDDAIETASGFGSGSDYDGPVLLLFTAAWSGACRATLDDLAALIAREMPGLRFEVVDIDQRPEVAQRFGISGVPMMAYVKAGEVVATRLGKPSKDDLASWLQTLT